MKVTYTDIATQFGPGMSEGCCNTKLGPFERVSIKQKVEAAVQRNYALMNIIAS